MTTSTNDESNYFTFLSNIGEIYSRVFYLFQQRWTGFISIALLVYITGWVCSLILSLMMGNDLSIDGFSINIQYVTTNGGTLNNPIKMFFYVLECFIYYIFSCIAHGASTWFIVHLYKNQLPTLQDAFSKAYEKKFTLVLVTILIFVVSFTPMFLLVRLILRTGSYHAFVATGILSFIWATIIEIITFVVYPIIMVETNNANILSTIKDSLLRSWTLTENHRISILGVVLSWAVVKLVLSVIVMYITFQGYPYKSSMIVYHLARFIDTMFGIFLLAIGSV